MLLQFLSFIYRQEQCNVLVNLMREYQTLKTCISSVTESTEPLIDISSVLKDHEETKRSLTKVREDYTFWTLPFLQYVIVNDIDFLCSWLCLYDLFLA